MIKSIIAKLPMRNLNLTKEFFISLGFEIIKEFSDYMMVKKDDAELHFFLFPNLDPLDNYGQIYLRVENIENIFKSYKERNIEIHKNGDLQLKPWGQKEFSLLDPDNNLLTFGESINDTQ